MPRSPIIGRFCQNPNCGKPIDPGRPKGTLYCDSSCRSEASRVRAEAGTPPPDRKALSNGAGRSRKPRKHTPYCVMKKNLDDGPIGGFEVVGFAAETNKARAIVKVAGSSEYVADGDQLIAVSIHNLRIYDTDGQRISEREPGWTA